MQKNINLFKGSTALDFDVFSIFTTISAGKIAFNILYTAKCELLFSSSNSDLSYVFKLTAINPPNQHFDFFFTQIMKLSVRKNVERPRPKRDYYSTKETVMVSKQNFVERISFLCVTAKGQVPTNAGFW